MSREEQSVVRVTRMQISDHYVVFDSRARRIIRRAAGKQGCEQGDRPGEIAVLGSRALAVEQALREAGVEVVETSVGGTA